MTALVAKKYWDKLKVWCYYHWKWLVLILAFVTMFLLGRKSNKGLLKQAQGALKSQKLESAAVERSHRLEIKKREKARKKYESAMGRIEKEHSEGQQQLDEAKKKASIKKKAKVTTKVLKKSVSTDVAKSEAKQQKKTDAKKRISKAGNDFELVADALLERWEN